MHLALMLQCIAGSAQLAFYLINDRCHFSSFDNLMGRVVIFWLVLAQVSSVMVLWCSLNLVCMCILATCRVNSYQPTTLMVFNLLHQVLQTTVVGA